MSSKEPVNVDILIQELSVICAKRWPSVITDDDVKNLREAGNKQLVLTRILYRVVKRLGMPSGDIDAAVARAKISLAPSLDDLIDSRPMRKVESVKNGDLYALVVEVDAALLNPAKRVRFPEWFVITLWPNVLRRLAINILPSDTEIAIARSLLISASE